MARAFGFSNKKQAQTKIYIDCIEQDFRIFQITNWRIRTSIILSH